MTPDAASLPQRIQRKRTKGWKMPEGAVYVGRPTKWGNPFKIGSEHEYMHWVAGEFRPYTIRTAAQAVTAFSESIGRGSTFERDAKVELRGHDLACFCPLDQPCHADVLLEIANA